MRRRKFLIHIKYILLIPFIKKFFPLKLYSIRGGWVLKNIDL